MPDYNCDGPHSPAQTRAAADEIAELVRYLNYATRDDAPGLEHPGDADRLVAALYTATGRMPQLFGQIEAFLDPDRLACDNGRDPWAAVRAAGYALADAQDAAGTLTRALQRAQNAIAGLSLKENDDARD